MSIWGRVSAILFLSVLQANLFANEKEVNEADYMRMVIRGESISNAGLPLEPKDDKWGEPNNGFVTQLIPQSKEYIIGKPMQFGLVMKNISDSVKEYDDQGAICVCSMKIKTDSNNCLYYKRGPYQTAGGGRTIESGKVVTLFERRDIAEEYVIINPGKYTIQFPGDGDRRTDKWELPPSNVIEFEVKPGTVDERDILINSLIDIFPDANWMVMTGPKHFAVAGRKDAQGNTIVLYRGRSRIRAMIWLTKAPAAINEQSEDPQTSEYLGKSTLGYFYITIPPRALELWPTMRGDIIKALKIENG